jgi:hypothetical protein
VVFREGRRRACLVLKVAFVDDGTAFLRDEYDALRGVRAVASPRALEATPVPLGLEEVDGLLIQVVRAFDGSEPLIPDLRGRGSRGCRRLVRTFLSPTLAWADELAASTLGEGDADEGPLGERVRRFATLVSASHEPGRRLAAFARAVETHRIRWRPCWQHGDLTVGNVWFRRGAPRVLDWELAGPTYEPWFDAAYAWLALVLLEQHRRPTSSVAEAARWLWSREAWTSRLGEELLHQRWRHPILVSWALAPATMHSALRAAERGDTGRGHWAELGLAMVADDSMRKHAATWVPDW